MKKIKNKKARQKPKIDFDLLKMELLGIGFDCNLSEAEIIREMFGKYDLYSVFTIAEDVVKDFVVLCMRKAEVVGLLTGKHAYLDTYRIGSDSAVSLLDSESDSYGNAAFFMYDLLFPEGYEEDMSNEYNAYAHDVLEDGTLDYLETINTVYIDDIYVVPEYRRLGIATQMIAAVDRIFGECSKCICLIPFDCPEVYDCCGSTTATYDVEEYVAHEKINQDIAKENGYEIAGDYAYFINEEIRAMLDTVCKSK